MVEIVVPVTGKVKIRLPYDSWNKTWLKGFSRVKYLGNGVWQIDRTRWALVKAACVVRFDRVDVWRHFRVEGEVCTGSCQNARAETVDSCECVCAGTYHGRADYVRELAGDLVLVKPGAEVCRFERFESGVSVWVDVKEVGE